MTAAALSVLVIGLGNPDRGDDGIGARVLAELAGRLPPGATMLACRGDVLALIDEWSKVDALVCVDAAESRGGPGRVHRFDLTVDDMPRGLSFASSHAIGLAEAFALAQTLGRAPPEIIVYAIEGATFDIGAGLSSAVKSAAGDVATHIIAEVQRLQIGAMTVTATA